MRCTSSLCRISASLAIAFALALTPVLRAQQALQVFLSAVDAEGKPVLSAKPTEHLCEKCGKPMVIREGRRGPFLACTGYPKCKNAQDVDKDGNPIKPVDLGLKCEKCGKPMAIKKGFGGRPFLGCTGYPTCRSTMSGARPRPRSGCGPG